MWWSAGASAGPASGARLPLQLLYVLAAVQAWAPRAVQFANVDNANATGVSLDTYDLARSFGTGPQASGYALAAGAMMVRVASGSDTGPLPALKLLSDPASGTEVAVLA